MKNLIVSGGCLAVFLFCAFSRAGFVSAEGSYYPDKVPCPGPVVEVKMLNGKPALFFDGKPNSGIMTNPNPKWGVGILPLVKDGTLILTNRPGYYAYRSVSTTNSFSGAFSVEAEVAIKEITRAADGNVTLSIRDSKSNAYLLNLSENKDGRKANLWKEEAGLEGYYRKWITVPFAWEVGKAYRLKMAFDGKTVSGFVDGQSIGSKEDDKPLTSGKVELSVYHSISSVDEVVVARSDNTVLFRDDFSKPRSWDWGGQPLEPARTFAESGVHIYTAVGWGGTDPWSECWLGPGKYDFSKVDRDFAGLLREDPQALIFPRLYLNAPEWWMKAHPEEASILDAKSWTSPDKRPSFTSQLWLKDVGEFLRQYIRHINSSPYGKHCIGFVLGGGHALEWVYNWGPYFHDYSGNQLAAYVNWLKTRYPDVAALRAAWQDPGITFETVKIPTAKDRMKGDYYAFYNPASGRRVSDYLRFHSIAVSDAIVYLSRIAKEETGGKKMTLAFYGYHLGAGNIDTYMDTGHQDLARVLDCPDIDALGSPHAYDARQPGGITLCSLPVDSVQLHNKLFFDEDDIRTHLSAATKLSNDEGRAQNLEQTVSIMKRDFAYCLSKGIDFWWMDWGNGWYNDDTVMSTVNRIQQLASESLTRDRSKAAEIALIVSERSMDYLRTAPGLLTSVLHGQVYGQVTRIGAPFDVYLTSDLGKMPDYRMYIFLDTFYLSENDRKVIREKILGRKHTVLWMYAPGYVTDKGLSANAVSDITGIRLAVEDAAGELSAVLSDTGDPATRGLDSGLRWKAGSGPIGPIFSAVDKDARVLATLTAAKLTDQAGAVKAGEFSRPGLVVKNLPGWRSIWCGVPEMPSALLRQIARSAGVHIYADSDDAVYANNSMVAVHARSAGKRTIRLPGKFTVTDAFTGQKIAGKTDSFELDLNQAETGFWLLDK